MATTCPQCERPIPFRTILVATCPIWITCPSCSAKLVGNRLVKIQALVLVPLIALLGGITVALTQWSWELKLVLILFGGLALGVPNVFVALKWGRYAARRRPAGRHLTGGTAR